MGQLISIDKQRLNEIDSQRGDGCRHLTRSQGLFLRWPRADLGLVLSQIKEQLIFIPNGVWSIPVAPACGPEWPGVTVIGDRLCSGYTASSSWSFVLFEKPSTGMYASVWGCSRGNELRSAGLNGFQKSLRSSGNGEDSSRGGRRRGLGAASDFCAI